MTAPDHGVDLLLRRATDNLRPDVARLVAGGITRGRTRQRRARIGTAVAAVAVFGVIGAAAAVVPQLGSAGRETTTPGYASDSPTPTAAETPLPTAVFPPLTVAAADMPAFVDQILGTTLASAALVEPPFGVKDEPRNRTVHFRYNGMLASIIIEPAPTTRMTCEVSTVCQVDSESMLKAVGPTTADGVTSQGVEARRYGYVVSVLSYNAALGKDSPALSSEPPLSLDQLLLIAGSDVWFTGLPASG